MGSTPIAVTVTDLVFVIVVIVLVLGTLVYAGSNSAYDEIGRGGFEAEPPKSDPSGADRDAEIMQLLHARNEQRERKGQAPLDVEAEFARLHKPAAVPQQLLAEVRQQVASSNARRARRGEEPLDEEAEVARLLAQLD